MHPPVALGIDHGDARIGVAVSDALGMLAHPLETVAAQPEARLLLAFHRLRRGSAYSRRLAHRKPARATPVLCLDAVDYARAPPPFAL
jgi:hypothetical protein